MNHGKSFMRGLMVMMLIFVAGLQGTAHGQTNTISQVPLFLTQAVTPLVMLNMSNDHQLFFEAYPDYADLTGNGLAERTYNHSIDYYGYFDAHKCYVYSISNRRFEPVSITNDKYCNGQQQEWSGNFLNYVSMARIDVIRKILYGGLRSTDTTSATILERTYLPNDGHSWVRYYDGNDLDRLTPFALPLATSTTSASSWGVPGGSLNNSGDRRTFSTNWTTAQVQVGDQLRIESRGTGRWMLGVVLSFNAGNVEVQVTSSSGANTQNLSDWNLLNESRRGISFCNTTVSNTQWSQDVTDPPLIRVASGNYSLWTANERWQCRWSDERNRTGHAQMRIGELSFSNGNDISSTGIPANSDNPVRATVGLGAQNYVARVNACSSDALIGNEQCQRYPDGNLKPVGLLQNYGESGSIHFGLLAGSYMRNKSGGMLRKPASGMEDEINIDTNGTFKAISASGGIIGTLDRLRPYGYSHNDGTYNSGDSCSWGLNSFNDGNCTNWGNPQAEIFLESLRYLAGAGPTAAFLIPGTTDRIAGLPALKQWQDPLNEQNWCAPLSIINFNNSVISYDADQLGGVTAIGASNAATLTDIIGAGEGIHGNNWFVGEAGASTNQLCTAKTVGNLASVRGLCPDAPRLSGSFHIAGLAHYAYTQSIRNDLSDSTGNTVDIQVKTYGVTLAPAVPRIEIPKPGDTEPAVTLLPACRNSSVGGNCAIVDLKIIDQDVANGTGSFLVQWEDSEQGGDYDMDMNGILSYVITQNNITVTTNVFSQSTPYAMGFGYVISGTTEDGFQVHSGINNFNYSSGTTVPGCSNCVYNNSPTSHVFTLGASSADLLQEPLYYAAKWGGYNKSLDFPDNPLSWDSTGDGLPDNYYFAIDPAKLAEDMGKVFAEISAVKGSATAVAANSTSIQTGSMIYQAKFNSEDWSGQLLALALNLDGTINFDPTAPGNWDTHPTMDNVLWSSRKIYTSTASGPRALTSGGSSAWNALDESQKIALAEPSNPPTLTTDEVTVGRNRLDWILGDRSNELPTGTLRQRNHRLGDIVNSDPFFESTTKTVYVGANDGMLHAFNAENGSERFAYIPRAVFTNLADLTKVNYTEFGNHRFFVNGSPIVAKAGNQLILVGTTGAGGRSIFALDVTNPDAFDANKVLWEFTGDQNANLGYTLAQPIIGRVGDNWVAIFGNGYNSDNHRAVLFVLDLFNGQVLHEINTGAGDVNNPNGLSSPAVVPDAAGNIIAVYAGDKLGNLWKFNPSTGTVEFGGNPLFTARDGSGAIQPITAGVAVGRHPQGGHLVFFGTGQYFAEGDQSVGSTIQSLYGIWDKEGGTAIDLTNRSMLQSQEILGEAEVAGNNFRLLSKEPIDWDTQRGWYVDLIVHGNLTGERVVDKPILNLGRAIFTTIIPYALENPCDPKGTTWFLAVDMLTGGQLNRATFDVNRDGSFDSSDTVTVTLADGTTATGFTSGFEAVTAGIARATLITTPSGTIDVILSGIDALTTTADSVADPNNTGSGVQMYGALPGQRTWRQLR